MNERIALITGASRGLGRALARGLAADGYRLIVDARDGESLAKAVAGLDAIVLPGDVTSAVHRSELAAAVAQQGAGKAGAGGLDLLVNNAGTLGASPLPALADYPVTELRDAFEANVLAPLALTQLLLPALRARGGAVLNITSDAAVEPYSGWGGYGASKAALEQLSNILAAEESAIRVWWADPGDLRTDMHQAAFPGEDISDRPEPASVVPGFLALIRERYPSGRYRIPELVVP